jgi:hypothetical protein
LAIGHWYGCMSRFPHGCYGKLGQSLRQEQKGIALRVPFPDLKMEVRASGITSLAHGADLLALSYGLLVIYQVHLQMGIKGVPAVAMVNEQHPPISRVIPTGIDHKARIRGQHRRTFDPTDINGPMVAPELLGDGTRGRPNKVTGTLGSALRDRASVTMDELGDVRLLTARYDEGHPRSQFIGLFQPVDLIGSDGRNLDFVLLSTVSPSSTM